MKTLKKVLFGLGFVFLLTLGLTLRVDAASGGKCGTNLKWTLDDNGKLTISGTGKMKDYTSLGRNRAPWADQSTTGGKSAAVDMRVRSVVIKNGVTSVGDHAFDRCVALGSVSLPNSLRSIGGRAFRSCVGLQKVTIPKNVTIIGASAFEGCTSLPEITIPASVETIGISAFKACVGIKKAVIAGPLKNLGGSAFMGCVGLTDIVIPGSVGYLNTSTFEGCQGLKSVKFTGNYMWSIGICAFKGCTSLKDIELPESVYNIDQGAFAGCVSLTEVTIPGRVQTLKSQAYVGCINLKKAVLGQGVKTIESAAFSQCPQLTEIIIPKSVKTMKSKVFDQCPNLSVIKYAGRTVDWQKIKGIKDHALDGVKPQVKYISSAVKSLKMSNTSISLAKKQSFQLLLKINPVYSSKKVEWSTSDFKRVSVNANGYVTAYKTGKVTIKAKCGGKTAKCKVTVYSVDPAESIRLTRTSVSLRVGRRVTLQPVIKPSKASGTKLTYTIDNPEVAKVSDEGVVTAKKAGKATVTVTTLNGKTAKCKITVS